MGNPVSPQHERLLGWTGYHWMSKCGRVQRRVSHIISLANRHVSRFLVGTPPQLVGSSSYTQQLGGSYRLGRRYVGNRMLDSPPITPGGIRLMRVASLS